MNRRDVIQGALLGAGVAGLTSWTHALSCFLRANAAEISPGGWNFYESNGDILFPIYDTDGAVSTKFYCCIFRGAAKGKHVAIPMEFTLEEIRKDTDGKKALEKLLNAMKQEPVPVDLNGGSLPRVSE